jgi:hypothetical protein
MAGAAAEAGDDGDEVVALDRFGEVGLGAGQEAAAAVLGVQTAPGLLPSTVLLRLVFGALQGG